jgi:hypothetical protein
MATKINTNQINTNASARFTSDAEMLTKANIANVANAFRIPFSDPNWSSGNTVYTFSTAATGNYEVFNNSIGRNFDGAEITKTSTGFTLANPVLSGDVLFVSGSLGVLGNLIQAPLPLNQIQGEGTASPSTMVIPPLGGSTNVTVSSVVNTDSPYSSQLPFKRRVTNAYISGASVYYVDIINQLPTPPSSISLGFWINNSDVSAAFTGGRNYEVLYYDTSTISAAIFDITTVIAAIGNNQTGSVSNSLATSNWKAVCLDKQLGYSFVAITIYNLVYSGSYVPSPMFRFYQQFTGYLYTWTKVDFAGMVLLFNQTIISSDVYPDGINNLQYPASIPSNFNSIQSIINKLPTTGYKFKISLTTNNIIVRTSFNSIYDIAVTFNIAVATNGAVNTASAKLLLKSAATSSAGLPLHGADGDDAAPMLIANGYFGGNHGNSGCVNIVATAHGKDVTDEGSKWVDGAAHNFYIVKVIDTNNFWVMGDNVGTSTNWSYITTISGNLTYVSGAQHTGNITVASFFGTQLTPGTKNVSISVLADGIAISGNGDYAANTLDIVETYDVVDTPSAVAQLVANRPVGGYLTHPALNIGPAVVSVRNYYNIQEQCKIALYVAWIDQENIYLNYFGGTQNSMNPPYWYANYTRYFPASLPISDGTNTFDFRVPISIISPGSPACPWVAQMDLTSSYWEDGKPVTRVIDNVTDGANLNINFNMGILPVGIGTIPNRINNITDAWQISTNRKLYPKAIDSKINNGSGYVPAGTIKQFAMFRGWSEKTSARTNMYTIKFGNSYYVILDWHIVTNDVITLPNSMLGKTITVNRQTSNVTITETLVTGVIEVSVTASTPQYAYLELIIS